MAARVLLDGRYRLDAVIRRSRTVTVHAATHRNGASAWLKMPATAAHAELIVFEASFANAIGSPLTVRDDGVTPEGLPYLVLDPPVGESVAALRRGGYAGRAERLSPARVMTAGDALARLVASVHSAGYVTAGLDDEDVLIFASGEVALLDLHALVPSTPNGILADCKHVLRILSALVSDVMDASAGAAVRPALERVLRGKYSDVTVLQLAWRGAAPRSVDVPPRARAASFADPSSVERLTPHDTPLSMSVGDGEALAGAARAGGEAAIGGGGEAGAGAGAGDGAKWGGEAGAARRDPDGSVIGYLRTGGVQSVIPQPVGPQERGVMYDPLSRIADMPRLVQATSRRPDASATPSNRGVLTAAVVAAALLCLTAGGLLVSRLVSSPRSSRSVSASVSGVDEPSRLGAAPALDAPALDALAVDAPGVDAPAVDAPAVDAPAAPPSMPVVKASPPSSSAGEGASAVGAVATGDDAADDDAADDLELTTILRSESAPPGRQVFIDGQVVGTTPLAVEVPCGRHDLQMVAGAPRVSVDLPCGGERVVRYDAKGRWTIK